MRNRTFAPQSSLAAASVAALVSGCGGGSTTTDPVSFTAGVDRHFSSGQTERLSVDGTSVVTRSDDGWGVTVDGTTVEFDSSDLGAHPALGPSVYFKELDDDEVIVFWSGEGNGFSATGDTDPEFEYLDVYGFSRADTVPGADLTTFEPEDFTRGDYAWVVQGVPTADVPISGTATYSGRARAREWRTDSAVLTADSTVYDGRFDMTATFGADESDVAGTFNFTDAWHRGNHTSISDGVVPFASTVTGNRLSVTGASISTGRFAGYEQIGINAAFFGPEAAEVGGVFEGENPTASTVMHGYFAATQE